MNKQVQVKMMQNLTEKGNPDMLYWAAVFFVIALVAALLGFGGITVVALEISRILFFIFLVLFIISLILGVRARNRYTKPE